MRVVLANRWIWHPWFAWYPIEINRTLVWLETVERKIETSNEAGVFYEYRMPGEIDLTPRETALAGEFVKEGHPMQEAIEMAALTRTQRMIHQDRKTDQ